MRTTRAVATGVLPISQLAPGDYVVRVTVTPDGRAGGRIIRTLRKIGVQPVRPTDIGSAAHLAGCLQR